MAETIINHRTNAVAGRRGERHPSWHRYIPPSARLHILVVDDNEDAAESMAMLLRIDGHEVKTAYEGPSAVRIAAEWNPQAMVQDIGMPGMSGYDVAKALRQRSGTKDILLIAVTGSEDRARSKDAGFNHHLVKPVSFEEIRRILTNLHPEAEDELGRKSAA